MNSSQEIRRIFSEILRYHGGQEDDNPGPATTSLGEEFLCAVLSHAASMRAIT